MVMFCRWEGITLVFGRLRQPGGNQRGLRSSADGMHALPFGIAGALQGMQGEGVQTLFLIPQISFRCDRRPETKSGL
jgi:hypothetical protein